MSGLIAHSPKALREMVRQGSYPNSEIEGETIARADAAADAIVQRHTTIMRTEAVELIEEASSMVRVADELVLAMVNDVRVELDSGVDPRKVAVAYSRLESDTHKMIASLRHEAAKAELLADRLEDPAEDYERLVSRFSALRQPIAW